MTGDGYAVNLENDTRLNAFVNNIDRVMKTLSVTSEFLELEYTSETGPGLFVAQKLDESQEEFFEQTEPNAWHELDNGYDVYIDDEVVRVYDMVEESVRPDGALLVTPHGRPMNYNVHFNVPDPINHEVDTKEQKGSKHKSAKAVSKVDGIWWTKVLSSEEGSIVTYRDGERDGPEQEREKLIDKVNSGEADWLIKEVLDEPEQYDWLDLEGYDLEQ